MQSAVIAQLLAEAKSCEPAQPSRLMPYREAILAFRAKRISYEAIAAKLRRHGVMIHTTAVGDFVRQHCPRAEVERLRRELMLNPDSRGSGRATLDPVPMAAQSGPRPSRIARDDL